MAIKTKPTSRASEVSRTATPKPVILKPEPAGKDRQLYAVWWVSIRYAGRAS